MTPKRLLRLFVFSILLTLCLSAPARSLPDEPIADMTVSPAGVTWTPRVEYSSLVLTVASPDGEIFRREFARGTNPSFSLIGQNGLKLMDGHYTYELRLIPIVSAETRAALAASRELGDGEDLTRALRKDGQLPEHDAVQSGSFLVAQGAILSNSTPESKSSQDSIRLKNSVSTELTTSGSANTLPELVFQDQVIPDDLIVQASLCVGFDCVTNESFGATTIKLKENNLRIFFEDTSTSAGYPDNDWQIATNETTFGGINRFSIEDVSGGKIPFSIIGGAPTNSLFVSSDGNLGLGTATPGLDVHLNTTNTPAIRLDQSNAGGFTAQVWDIGGNEANFFIRDLTGGSKLSFRIRPGAPTSSIDIAGNGWVGIGESSPQAKLDVKTNSSDGSASGLRISEQVGNALPVALANLYNSNSAGQLDLFTVSGTQNVQLSAGGTSYLNGGNVGIGTNNPGYKLDVAGAVNATSLYVNGTPLNTASLASGTGTTNKIVKWSNGTSSALSNSLVFDNGSGVGINTTDLSDTIATGDVKFKVVDGPMTLSFRDYATGQGYLAIGSTNGIKGFVGHTNLGDGFTMGTSSTHKLTFRTNSVNRMTIDTAGNVGIGTTSPQSTLQVNGYVQLALTSGAPPAADCDNSSEYGRMKVDATNSKLYVCTATGWKSTALTP